MSSKIISKKKMGERVAKAANATPNIEDRLRHAESLAGAHPAADTPLAAQSQVSAFEQDGHQHSMPRFMTVPVDLIDQNPFNARKIYRPERVNELASSIGAHGQEVPGIATTRGDRYVLAAGHYRLRAIKVLGLKTMDLMVHDSLSDKELYGQSYRENAEREGQSALDNALSWRELLDMRVYADQTELAEATGMSLPNINKTLRILQLSEPVLDIVKEDPGSFALSSLYELALFEAVAGLKDTLAMARLLKEGEAGRKDIQEARSKIETPKERKRKETSRQYKIQREGAQIGTIKAWDSGRVVFDVVLPDVAERDEILAELKRRFGVSG